MRRLKGVMRKRRTRYEKIIRFVQEKPSVTLEAFLGKYPEIPSSTYRSTLSALNRHGLLEKNQKAKRKTVYHKTNRFTIERAIETLRTANKKCKHRETINLEETVREAVRNIVDPATNLTFAQMQIEVEVREKESGFVEIDFTPVFCPMATELSAYIKNVTSQICDIREISVCCRGHMPRIGNTK